MAHSGAGRRIARVACRVMSAGPIRAVSAVLGAAALLAAIPAAADRRCPEIPTPPEAMQVSPVDLQMDPRLAEFVNAHAPQAAATVLRLMDSAPVQYVVLFQNEDQALSQAETFHRMAVVRQRPGGWDWEPVLASDGLPAEIRELTYAQNVNGRLELVGENYLREECWAVRVTLDGGVYRAQATANDWPANAGDAPPTEALPTEAPPVTTLATPPRPATTIQGPSFRPSPPPPPDAAACAACGTCGGFGLLGLLAPFVLLLALAVVLAISHWRVFTKAGEPGWAAFVPIYNVMVLARIGGEPEWFGLLMLLPCINIYFWFVVQLKLAERFGMGAGFGLGLVFLPMVFYPILAFGSATALPLRPR
jgi:hypothetical protein